MQVSYGLRKQIISSEAEELLTIFFLLATPTSLLVYKMRIVCNSSPILWFHWKEHFH